MHFLAIHVLLKWTVQFLNIWGFESCWYSEQTAQKMMEIGL
jgi:hypothetical protein